MAFVPAELQIAEGQTRETVLSVRNSSDRVMSGLRFTVRTDRGLHADVEGRRTGLAAGAVMTVPVSVRRTVEAPGSAMVFAIVAYAAGSGADAIESSMVATLTVTSPPTAVERKAEITIGAAGSREQLIQYQETDLFFTIANPSQSAQDVSPLVVSYPSYLTVKYLKPHGDPVKGAKGRLEVDNFATLKPGDAEVVRLSVAADQPLQPGKVLVHVTARATDRTDGSVGTAVGSQTIDLQVLGESGVLTLLGVPALLFVPGLVWILVLWALWRFVAPKRDFSLNPGGQDKLVEGKVALWVFALLPSLAFPFIYPVVTGALGQERDYRKAYGLDDILYVWIMAAVAALLVWAIAVSGRWAYVRLFIPRERDRPLTLLAKYGRRLWRRSLPHDGMLHNGTQRVFLLSDPGKERVLVTPAIEYQASKLHTKDQQVLGDSEDLRPFRLWRILRKSDLAYERDSGPLAGPTLVETKTLTDPFTEKLWQPSTRLEATEIEADSESEHGARVGGSRA